jgi:hypothetical protein
LKLRVSVQGETPIRSRVTRSTDGLHDETPYTMKPNELMLMPTRTSARPLPVDDVQTVPSYLQRYADEREAWQAQWPRQSAKGPLRGSAPWRGDVEAVRASRRPTPHD